MICGECGVEIGVETDEYFFETCIKCGRVICPKCVRFNGGYHCTECIVNTLH